MMGALAWQATVIKDGLLVSWGEIARGLVFWPRVLPPSVCLCACFLLFAARPVTTAAVLLSGHQTRILSKEILRVQTTKVLTVLTFSLICQI